MKARHRLDQLLVGLKAADESMVTELDRLGRGTGEAILLMDDLIRRGVVLRVLALPSLDIITNDGRLIAEARSRLAGDEPVRVVARAYRVSDKTLRATLARARPTLRMET